MKVSQLLVVNCEFYNTSGTPPSNGVDIEPFQVTFRRLVNLVFRDCRFVNNAGGGLTTNRGATGPGSVTDTTWLQGIRVHGCEFTGLSAPGIKADFGSQVRYPYWSHPQRDLDVTVSTCVVRDGTVPAVFVSNLFSKADVDSWPGEGRRTGHWQGTLRFVGCDLGTGAGEAVRIQEKSALSAGIVLENCTLRSADAAVHVLAGADPRLTTPSGGLEFLHCTVHVPRTFRRSASRPQAERGSQTSEAPSPARMVGRCP